MEDRMTDDLRRGMKEGHPRNREKGKTAFAEFAVMDSRRRKQ
jgi:hypothetical protein